MNTRFAIIVTILSLASLAGPASATEQAGVVSRRPSMSPSGSLLAFASDMTGGQNIWISNADGTGLRRLTSGDVVDDDPSFSPDGSTILFSRKSGAISDIWTIGVDGSQLTQLTNNSLNNKAPSWSPDGQRIAFVSNRGGTNDIWLISRTGASPTRITSLPGQENDPSFDPSGTQIVFSETAFGQAALMIVNIDGSGMRPLTDSSANDWRPRWSSNGIVFSSNRGSAGWNIWFIQSNGNGLKKIGGAGLDPSWAGQGALLFTDEFGGGASLSTPAKLDLSTGVKVQILPPSFSGDLNGDGIIDNKDIAIIQAALNKPAQAPYDARDRNADGRIDALDARILTNLCTYPRCASNP